MSVCWPELNSTTNDWRAKSVGPNNVFGVDPATGSPNLSGLGGRFGGYAGWDMGIAPNVIAGSEADIAGIAGAKKTVSGLPGASYFGATPADNVSATPNFDAGLRARLGYVVDPAFLVYGTTGRRAERRLQGQLPGQFGGVLVRCAGKRQSQQDPVRLDHRRRCRSQGGGSTRGAAQYRYADFGSQNLNFFYAGNSGADNITAKTNASGAIS